MDTLKFLDLLEKIAVQDPYKMPLIPVYWGLDQKEISMMITKIRATLPQELKVAAATNRETDKILQAAEEDAEQMLASAQKEAERILAEATAEAERIRQSAILEQTNMVQQSEILKLSKAQSEEVRNAAEREASQMRRGAEKYAYDTLVQLEGVISKAMSTIDRGKQDLSRTEPAGEKPRPR